MNKEINELKFSEEVEVLKEYRDKCEEIIYNSVFNLAEKLGMYDVNIPYYYKDNNESSHYYFTIKHTGEILLSTTSSRFMSVFSHPNYLKILENMVYSIEKEYEISIENIKKEQEDCIEFLKQFGEE